MDQFQGVRLTAGSDKTDVPNYRPLSIEIGRRDIQPSPFFIFGGDGLHDFWLMYLASILLMGAVPTADDPVNNFQYVVF